jgi:uncharacterized protein (DUF4415 family)
VAKSKPNPYLVAEENPDWTAEDFKKARPAGDVLREVFSKDAADGMLIKKPGRPLGCGIKESKTVRFDRDVLDAFRATGKGWQTRMNQALRERLLEHGARG